MTRLDFTPLTTPVTKEEIAAFRRESKTGTVSATSIIMLIVVGIAIVLFFTTIVRVSTSSGGGMASSVTLIVVIAVVLTGLFFLYRILSRGIWRRRLAITRFAAANGLDYAVKTPRPNFPGAIFALGSSRQAPERLYRGGDRPLDLGNYQYTTGSGKSRRTHNWGYLAIKLDRMLPHMILDAKANNFLGTNLPVSFSRDQVLSLEGDFDRHFTLYCPKQYERDALYVFTPDLMARLIDEAALFDVEIVDDWMFLYSARTFDLAAPATLARLFRIVDTVGDRTLSRTERYADSKLNNSKLADSTLAAADAPATTSASPLHSRMAVNQVANQGRRLKRGVPIIGIIMFAVIVAFWSLNFLPFFRGS